MTTIWTGDNAHRFAPALLTLLRELEAACPGAGWQTSPQTGTIGDPAHFAEGSASDHNPWLDNTVRALDVAANVAGVPGILTVTDAPRCEALFQMVNAMYAARDPRVYPDGYAIYRGRITDWLHPGQFHAHTGDPHLYHLHISASRNPAGFNRTDPWPLPTTIGDDMPLSPADITAIGNEFRQVAAGLVEATAARVAQYENGTNNRVVEIDGIAHQLLTLEGQQSAQQFAAAVVAELPAGSGLTADAVGAALFDRIQAALSAEPSTQADAPALAAAQPAPAQPAGVAHDVQPAA